jgi:hypothetical protein
MRVTGRASPLLTLQTEHRHWLRGGSHGNRRYPGWIDSCLRLWFQPRISWQAFRPLPLKPLDLAFRSDSCRQFKIADTTTAMGQLPTHRTHRALVRSVALSGCIRPRCSTSAKYHERTHGRVARWCAAALGGRFVTGLNVRSGSEAAVAALLPRRPLRARTGRRHTPIA